MKIIKMLKLLQTKYRWAVSSACLHTANELSKQMGTKIMAQSVIWYMRAIKWCPSEYDRMKMLSDFYGVMRSSQE